MKVSRGRLRTELALFQARTDDELTVGTSAGGRTTFQNAGRAQRTGLELSGALPLADAWLAEFAVTWLDAHFVDGFLACTAAPCTVPTLPVAAGTRIPGIPRTQAQAAVRWGEVSDGWHARVEGVYVDAVPVNNFGDEAAPSYAVFNASVGYGFDNGRVFVALDNLGDRVYAGSVIVNEANRRYYEPAPGRGATVGVELHWRDRATRHVTPRRSHASAACYGDSTHARATCLLDPRDVHRGRHRHVVCAEVGDRTRVRQRSGAPACRTGQGPPAHGEDLPRRRLESRRNADARAGVQVKAFATGLVHPRWLYVLPNGDVLVAETNRPPTPDEPANPHPRGVHEQGVREGRRRRARAPIASRCCATRTATALRKRKTMFLANLFSPFGMALVGDRLYVANADALVWVPYKTGDTQIAAAPQRLDRPARRAAQPSLDEEPGRHRRMARSSTSASVPTAMSPRTAWTSRTGRARDPGNRCEDRCIARVRERPAQSRRHRVGTGYEGAVHGGQRTRRAGQRPGSRLPDLGEGRRVLRLAVELLRRARRHAREAANARTWWRKAIAPDYALGPHVASLGLAFSAGDKMPAAWRNGAFIGLHGSWNRDPQSGYKVIFVPFANGKPAGEQQEVLTGFLDAQGNAHGRPVGVAMAKDGALLVADDVGNVVWRVAP